MGAHLANRAYSWDVDAAGSRFSHHRAADGGGGLLDGDAYPQLEGRTRRPPLVGGELHRNRVHRTGHVIMPTQQTVLLVGGTGRTGRRVLQQLLDRGVSVRAIVRSGGKLPPDVAGNPNLTVIEASLLSLPMRSCSSTSRLRRRHLLSRSRPQPQGHLRTAARPRHESDDAPVPRDRSAAAPSAGQVHPHEQRLGQSPRRPRHAPGLIREGVSLGALRRASSGQGQPASRGLPAREDRAEQRRSFSGRWSGRTRSSRATSRSTRCTRAS